MELTSVYIHNNADGVRATHLDGDLQSIVMTNQSETLAITQSFTPLSMPIPIQHLLLHWTSSQTPVSLRRSSKSRAVGPKMLLFGTSPTCELAFSMVALNTLAKTSVSKHTQIATFQTDAVLSS
jgi:hypothetical protein